MIRRKFFATLLAPLVARFVPKPKFSEGVVKGAFICVEPAWFAYYDFFVPVLRSEPPAAWDMVLYQSECARLQPTERRFDPGRLPL